MRKAVLARHPRTTGEEVVSEEEFWEAEKENVAETERKEVGVVVTVMEDAEVEEMGEGMK